MIPNWDRFLPRTAAKLDDRDRLRLSLLRNGTSRSNGSRASHVIRRFRIEFRPDDGTPAQVLAEGPGVETTYLIWADQLSEDEERGWLMLIDGRTNEPVIRRHLPR